MRCQISAVILSYISIYRHPARRRRCHAPLRRTEKGSCLFRTKAHMFPPSPELPLMHKRAGTARSAVPALFIVRESYEGKLK